MLFRLFDNLLLALPGFAIAIWAQWHIIRAYSAGSRTQPAGGRTGAEVASAILRAAGQPAIVIEPATGELTDHYDAYRRILRLAPRIHDGRSSTAIGVSAHEAGHALQQAARFRWLIVRNAVVPLASIGSQLFWLLILAGVLLELDRLIIAGIALFWSLLLLQLVNLPIELDASRRARVALEAIGITGAEQQSVLVDVMNAAAWTYVALTLSGIGRLATGWR